MSEPNLAEIQALMFSAITNPLTPNEGIAERVRDGRSTQEISDKIMKANDRMSGLERLEIYNRQYWFRLIDCIYDDYPGLRAVLGDKRFNEVVIRYLTKYPSRSYNLIFLGTRLPQFLDEHPDLCGQKRKAAQDMARFETAQMHAFHTGSLKPITPEMLQGMDPAAMRLYVQPYITLLKMGYPFDDFIVALKREDVQRSEASKGLRLVSKREKVKLPKAEVIYLAVHRFENQLYYKRLDKQAFILLQQLQQGKPLAAACEVCFPHFSQEAVTNGEAARLIQEWFQSWTRLGWFGIPKEEREDGQEEL